MFGTQIPLRFFTQKVKLSNILLAVNDFKILGTQRQHSINTTSGLLLCGIVQNLMRLENYFCEWHGWKKKS